MTHLVADIGGTSTRCAVTGAGGRPGPVSEYRNRDFESLLSLLQVFVDSLSPDLRPDAASLAVAAPIRGDDVRMINIDWHFSLEQLRQTLGLDKLRAVNDFEALAWALPDLRDDELVTIGTGRSIPGKPKGVLGPGTGLGVGSLIPCGASWVAVGGEGGHVTLPPADAEEASIIEHVRDELGHCSAERLISGPGLSMLHDALHGAGRVDAVEISRLAKSGDGAANETFAMFFRMLGTIAANLALTIGAFGGIYVGGGIPPRHRDRFVASGFRERFESKGRYGDYLKSIPTYLIVAAHPTLTGLAALARQSEQGG
ncbi:MAG: glucokinase [Gammaproteobacteria bacterium]